MFCMLHYVHSSFAIILMEKRELVALLSLPSWCVVVVVWLFLAVPWVCLQFVIVVFPDHAHLLFLNKSLELIYNVALENCFTFSEMSGGGGLGGLSSFRTVANNFSPGRNASSSNVTHAFLSVLTLSTSSSGGLANE